MCNEFSKLCLRFLPPPPTPLCRKKHFKINTRKTSNSCQIQESSIATLNFFFFLYVFPPVYLFRVCFHLAMFCVSACPSRPACFLLDSRSLDSSSSASWSSSFYFLVLVSATVVGLEERTRKMSGLLRVSFGQRTMRIEEMIGSYCV